MNTTLALGSFKNIKTSLLSTGQVEAEGEGCWGFLGQWTRTITLDVIHVPNLAAG